MNQRLTIDRINQLIQEFSKERTELTKELGDCKTYSAEGPIKQQLTSVQYMENTLMKMRSMKRKEEENKV